MLTSSKFVGMFVGSNIAAKARYQHAINGCEVPQCEGANQSAQAVRWRWLAPFDQSGWSEVLALGISVAWEATHACARRVSGRRAFGSACGARRCQAQFSCQRRSFSSETRAYTGCKSSHWQYLRSGRARMARQLEGRSHPLLRWPDPPAFGGGRLPSNWSAPNCRTRTTGTARYAA